jgi:serralysin
MLQSIYGGTTGGVSQGVDIGQLTGGVSQGVNVGQLTGGVSQGVNAGQLTGGTAAEPASGSYSQSATGNTNIDGILSGYKWTTTALTWRIPTSADQYDTNPGTAGIQYGDTARTSTFLAPTAAMTTATAEILNQMFGAVSGLSFTQAAASDTSADMSIGRSTADPSTNFNTAYAYYPTGSGTGLAGDSWYSDAYETFGSGYAYSTPVKGGYAWTTYIHEYGHNMGLKHGHQTGGPGNTAMSADRDSMEFSVMTYRSYVGQDMVATSGYQNEQWGFAQSLMMYDIAALQVMYGADFTTNNTNSVYTFSATTGQMFINGVGQGAPGGNRVFLTIWDGGGIDTYDFSNYTGNQSIDLTPGSWSLMSTTQRAHLGQGNYARGNVFNALQYNGDVRSLIENAIGGSGNDTMTGNDADNVLTGGAGSDSLIGGNGSDTASYQTATSRVVANLADASINTGDAAGDTYNSIENLTGSDIAGAGDALVGNSGRNILEGLAGNDQLFARAGDDVLYGGAGDDLLFGGLGADWLDGGADTDTVSYQEAGSGVVVDMLNASIQTGEAAGDQLINIENIIGSSFDDALCGNNGRNFLYGQDGNDVLFGRGGADVLYGGAGADTLFGGAGSDWLDGGAGFDYASYLDAGGAVTVDMNNPATNLGDAAGDQLIDIEGLVGSGFDDVLLGNNLGNAIFGADGNDVIYGRGGGDYLTGGAGADQFRFANAADAGDTISDFQRGLDTLQFSASGFGGGLTGGALAANRLVLGTAATQNFGQFIFDTSTSILYWDADGTGAGAKIAMMGLSNINTLSTSDFLINA